MMRWLPLLVLLGCATPPDQVIVPTPEYEREKWRVCACPEGYTSAGCEPGAWSVCKHAP